MELLQGITRLARPPLGQRTVVRPDSGMEDRNRLCLKPEALRAGNRVRLLRDGAEAYPSMLQAIARAERHILLEMYTFADDAVGREFAAALSERAAAGIEVRGISDHGFTHSIYFRDPDGYVIELTAPVEKSERERTVTAAGAHGALRRWQESKSG